MSQVFEFKYRKVRGKRGLHALFSHDTDANISHLYHGNIITTVTDTSNLFMGIELKLTCNYSLLCRTASAYTN